MKKRLLSIIAFLSFTTLLSAQVEADTTQPVVEKLSESVCEKNIRIGEEYYQLGKFNEVEKALKSCIENRTLTDSDYQNALVIMANTYIAMDRYATAKIYVKKLIEVDPNFQTRNNDLRMFQIMVEDTKLSRNGQQVSSVSKVAESLFEAPASVLVISEDEIRRRGYMDFEQLLHDLPGFDISRSNGILYSHIYQRGYRMNNTNRILLLVDGVEENDLWGNIVYLSRQYPLSNIKSVEVVYGPASTIYGANAFLGVISIITKNPREITGLNKDFGVQAEVGYGQNNTRYADVTIATDFPKQEIDISLTMRYFRSDEPDFSQQDTWHDFRPWDLDDRYNRETKNPTVRELYSGKLSISDSAAARSFNDTYGNHSNSDFFIYRNDSITPTLKGLESALSKDNDLIARERYGDYTETFLVASKIRFNNLLIGFQHWYKIEGLGVWYTDVQRSAQTYWSPRSTFAYIKYDKQINSKLSFSSFARYKLHGYHPQTFLTSLKGYRSGGLGLADLMEETTPYWDTTYYATISNQVRIENRLFYTPNKHFALVAGMENRLSAIQDNYSTAKNPYPLEVDSNSVKHYFSQDLGLFIQATYKFGRYIPALNNLNITAGLRWDRNKIWDNEGYGDNFSPRIVGTYKYKQYIAKAIFARAYKTPTNFDLYSTVQGLRDVANPELLPENVSNIEFSLRRFLGKEQRNSIEIVTYSSTYEQSIETRKAVTDKGEATTKFESVGFRDILGGQITADYRWNTNFGQFYFWGNYTFTSPIDESPIITNSTGDTIFIFENGQYRLVDEDLIDPESEAEYNFIRIGDIADHQFSLGTNYAFKGWNANLRMNFVGFREVGRSTNVYDNPFEDLFQPYAICHAALSYRFNQYGLTAQAVMNNIFNTQYYSPGLRTADIDNFSARLPQNGREIHIKMKFDLHYNLRKKSGLNFLE